VLLASVASFFARTIGKLSAIGRNATLGLPTMTGELIWAPLDFDTAHLGSDKQQAMINFRVDDLNAPLSGLAAHGVEIAPERSEDAALGLCLDRRLRRQSR